MSTNRKKIIAISGSTRTNSTNEKILRFIADRFKESLDIQLYNKISDLPHFNPELDNEHPPASVQEYRSTIEDADGILICTPEYVFSLPGVLKNGIEWMVSTTILSGKPIAFIVASGLGEHAFASLALILKTVEANVGEGACFLIQGAGAKVNADGQIGDTHILQQIDKLIGSLIQTINSKPSGAAQ